MNAKVADKSEGIRKRVYAKLLIKSKLWENSNKFLNIIKCVHKLTVFLKKLVQSGV